jgi:hypothetical protein
MKSTWALWRYLDPNTPRKPIDRLVIRWYFYVKSHRGWANMNFFSYATANRKKMGFFVALLVSPLILANVPSVSAATPSTVVVGL